MASSVARGAPVHKEPVDAVAHQRRRELQVVRAEGQACRRTADSLCLQIAEDQSRLESAVVEYGRRLAKLAERQGEAHDRLAAVLRGRSGAERRRERAHDRAENELRARKTASTVRAYRLDARWRQLHDRYRGFAIDVLATGGRPFTPPPPTPPPSVARRRLGPGKLQGRRFFAAADRLGTQYRRESLRTSRSLLTLMSGYLRETSSSGGQLVLDGAEPVQVLDKLRVMQEQCARIAERVRRRTTVGQRQMLVTGDGGNGGKLPQTNVLSEAQRTVTTGREYLGRVRRLMDTAVGELEREQVALRRLLCTACATCVGKRAPLRYNSAAVTEIAGRLERACFSLFARLERVGTQGPRPASDPAEIARAKTRDHRGPAAHDVVTLCLRAVHENRVNAVRTIRDTERRVTDFRKAVARLLLAAAPRANSTTDTGRHRSGQVVRPSHSSNRKTSAPSQRVAVDKTAAESTVPSLLQTKYYNYSRGAMAEFAVAVPTTVTMLCPPSIGVIQYE